MPVDVQLRVTDRRFVPPQDLFGTVEPIFKLFRKSAGSIPGVVEGLEFLRRRNRTTPFQVQDEPTGNGSDDDLPLLVSHQEVSAHHDPTNEGRPGDHRQLLLPLRVTLNLDSHPRKNPSDPLGTEEVHAYAKAGGVERCRLLKVVADGEEEAFPVGCRLHGPDCEDHLQRFHLFYHFSISTRPSPGTTSPIRKKGFRELSLSQRESSRGSIKATMPIPMLKVR